jgi:integrase/recombinase XerD
MGMNSETGSQAGLEMQAQGWLEGLRVRGYSPVTLRGRHQSLSRFFEHLRRQGIEDEREVAAAHVEGFQSWLMTPGRYASGTVAAHLTAVCLFFRYLTESHVILVNPCSRIVIPKLPRRLPSATLTRAEARRVLRLPDPRSGMGLRDWALLELFYSSGLRLAEMTALTLQDVDLRNRIVWVRQGKGRRDRVAPIGEKAAEALERYLREARAVWVTARGAMSNALWLSHRQPHSPLKKEAVAWIARRHARAALRRTVSPHRWRHAFATHLVSGGASIVHVQRLLGHRSIKTTEIYARVTVPELKATLRRVHPRERTRMVA